jgi:hypothetical protein
MALRGEISIAELSGIGTGVIIFANHSAPPLTIIRAVIYRLLLPAVAASMSPTFLVVSMLL